MSVEEDTELRDLVAQALETNGCLPKIRAELRASIFLTLDENDEVQKQEPLLNNKVKAQLDTREGQLMFCIVREFLEYFDLDYTISVYEPESYLGTNYRYEGRSKIIEELGLSHLKDDVAAPLLLQLIQLAQVKSTSHNINLTNQLENCNNFEESTNSSTTSNEETSSNLNETFNVAFPKTKLNINKNSSNNNTQHEESVSIDSIKEKSDVCDTSLLAEEIGTSNPSSEKSLSPPILKEGKLKLSSQKTEKIKTKTSLSSLADLPPLQLNKSSVLLPSLYSKEFKEKSSNQNLKELDRFFDVDVDYEEDFISESECSFNNSRCTDSLTNGLLNEQQSDTNTNVHLKIGDLNFDNTNWIKRNTNSENSSINNDEANFVPGSTSN